MQIAPSFEDARKARGLEIARSAKIVKLTDRFWAVPSQQSKGKYAVDPEAGTCMCPDFETHGKPCKHLYAVLHLQRHEITTPDGSTVVSEKLKITYAQPWAQYNRASCAKKSTARVLLRDLVSGVEQPRYPGMGRPALPLSDVLFAATWKTFVGCASREATTDIEDAAERELIDVAPHYNTVLRIMAQPEITPVLQRLVIEAATPLASVETQFAIDSTGFGTSSYANWHDNKWGKDRRFQKWLKCHAMVGTRTNVVVAAEVTEGNKADSPEFMKLATVTASRFCMKEVSADKGYLSRENLEGAEKLGAAIYVPFKINSSATGNGETWERLYHYFQSQREEWAAHYHRRSNSETTFSMIKRNYGSAVRARKEPAQKNEVLTKLIAHNLSCLVHEIHELGIDPKFWLPRTTATEDAR